MAAGLPCDPCPQPSLCLCPGWKVAAVTRKGEARQGRGAGGKGRGAEKPSQGGREVARDRIVHGWELRSLPHTPRSHQRSRTKHSESLRISRQQLQSVSPRAWGPLNVRPWVTALGHRPVKLGLAGGHPAHASEQTSGEAEERQEAPRDSGRALVTSSEPLGPAGSAAKPPCASQFLSRQSLVCSSCRSGGSKAWQSGHLDSCLDLKEFWNCPSGWNVCT